MSYEFQQTDEGNFAINWGLVRTILRSNVIAGLQLDYGTERVEENWFSPDIYTYEVNWDAVNESKEILADQFLEDFAQDLNHGSILFAKEKLREIATETRTKKQIFREKLQAAQQKSAANIAKSVDRYDNAITVAKITRDMSKEFVIIGATVLTGPGATAAIAAADAALDAAIEYQDNGNASAAAITFAGKFAIGLIPGGNTAGEAVAMAVIKAQKEAVLAGSVALVQGKKPAEAMTAAVAGAAGSGVGSAVGVIAKSSGFQRMLHKTAYPMTTKIHYTPIGNNPDFIPAKAGIDFTTGYSAKAVSTAYNNNVTKPLAKMAVEGVKLGGGGNGNGNIAVFSQLDMVDRAIMGPLH